MIFTETKLKGAFIIDIDPAKMSVVSLRVRGARMSSNARLEPRLVQCNISFNKKRGTLRECIIRLSLSRSQTGAVYNGRDV